MDLGETIKLRSGVVLKNRFALAPLTNTQANRDGTLSDDEYRWLKMRTSFGLLSTCAAYVSEDGKAWNGQLGVSSEVHIEGLTKLATGLNDTTAIVQLHHGGNKALAQNKISTSNSDGVKGATEEDIKRIICDFTEAALRVERAGFAGVEIHGANGYLFTQFLAPEDNPRRDQYGGSLENRARFLRETVRSVKKSVGSSFSVNVRISPVDIYRKRGLILEDAQQLSQWLVEDGVDIIHLSLKEAAGPPPLENTDKPVVTAIREVIPDSVKIEVAGGVWEKKSVIDVLDAGADIVAVGKAGIIHPDWPVAIEDENFSPKTPPWDPQELPELGLGKNFVEYLMKFPGLLIGGAPDRK